MKSGQEIADKLWSQCREYVGWAFKHGDVLVTVPLTYGIPFTSYLNLPDGHAARTEVTFVLDVGESFGRPAVAITCRRPSGEPSEVYLVETGLVSSLDPEWLRSRISAARRNAGGTEIEFLRYPSQRAYPMFHKFG